MAKLNERGHEVLDSTPAAVPLKFKRPLPMAEMVRQMVVRELSNVADKHGAETFEESDDFVVGDEPELRSPYELDADQENMKFIPEEPKDVKKPASTQNAGSGSEPPSGSGSVSGTGDAGDSEEPVPSKKPDSSGRRKSDSGRHE